MQLCKISVLLNTWCEHCCSCTDSNKKHVIVMLISFQARVLWFQRSSFYWIYSNNSWKGRRMQNSANDSIDIYSRTSMVWTSLGPQKIVRDMGSSSHWGLIMVPDQEENRDNLGIFFISFILIVCWVYSLESPRWGDSNEYTQHTISW